MAVIDGQNWDGTIWRREDGTESQVAELSLEEIKAIYKDIAGHPDALHKVLPSVLWEALRERANGLV